MLIKQIKISWPVFDRDIRRLAEKVNKRVDCIVAISRGGVVVGCLLSHIMKKPLAVVVVQSYKGKKRGKLSIGKFSTAVPLVGKMLLVDDLVDTGATIAEVRKRLLRMEKVRSVRTAVVYEKPLSAFKPEYSVRKLNQWVVFPYEK